MAKWAGAGTPRRGVRGQHARSLTAARWTLLFVLANLVANTVVTRFANAADQELPRAGVGYTAYSYAQTIWMLPQSVVTVSLVTALLLRRRLEGRLDGRRLCRTYGRLTAAALTAGALGWLAARSCSATALPPAWAPALSLVVGGATMGVLFLVLAQALKVGELRMLPGFGAAGG